MWLVGSTMVLACCAVGPLDLPASTPMPPSSTPAFSRVNSPPKIIVLDRNQDLRTRYGHHCRSGAREIVAADKITSFLCGFDILVSPPTCFPALLLLPGSLTSNCPARVLTVDTGRPSAADKTGSWPLLLYCHLFSESLNRLPLLARAHRRTSSAPVPFNNGERGSKCHWNATGEPAAAKVYLSYLSYRQAAFGFNTSPERVHATEIKLSACFTAQISRPAQRNSPRPRALWCRTGLYHSLPPQLQAHSNAHPPKGKDESGRHLAGSPGHTLIS